jgi:hypothetical protein
VGGALEEQEFLTLLREVGFDNSSIEPTRIYGAEDAAALISGTSIDPKVAELIDGQVMSGFVRATKPGIAALPVVPVASSKPKRELRELGSSAPKRACGCDDGCCT